jgi:hypothetical protein
MRADRTLVVEVQIKQDGVISGGSKRYRPGDPHYGEVIDHIGGIKPGETKLVPEWPPKSSAD